MIEDTEINQAEAHEGASPPQDVVLDALPKETATDILKTAQRFGVREDDPLWVAILTILHASDLTESVQDASTRIEDATKEVGEIIFNQTVHAGNDLKTLLAASIEEKTVEAGQALVTAIAHAAGKGAADLQKAAADLPKLVAKKKEETLSDWQASLASTAAVEAAERARRGEWVVMGAALVFGLVMAVAGIWIGYQMAPRTWPAAASPAAVWRFPKRNLDEFAWAATDARVARSCLTGDVCLELRRR